MVWLPTSDAAGVQSKSPEELMSELVREVPGNVSLRVYKGLTNPEGNTTNESAVPESTNVLGLNDWIVICGVSTVICSVTVVLWPEESVTSTLIVWTPTSDDVGVQLKSPEELMSELETLLPEKESLTVYVGLVKPVGDTMKERGLP
jgi:hypothetical protein